MSRGTIRAERWKAHVSRDEEVKKWIWTHLMAKQV